MLSRHTLSVSLLRTCKLGLSWICLSSAYAAILCSWMERGGAALLRHLQHEHGQLRKAMSWSERLQKQLREDISARLPDAVVRPLLYRPWCGPVSARLRPLLKGSVLRSIEQLLTGEL